MGRISTRRSLIFLLVLLGLVVATADILRPGSFIVGTWRRLTHRQTPMERSVEDFQRTHEVPLPRSNRMETRPTRGSILPARTHTPG
jgi:hypothetical protein